MDNVQSTPLLSHAFPFGAICTLWDHRRIHLGCNRLGFPLDRSVSWYLWPFGRSCEPYIEPRGFGSPGAALKPG